MQILCFMSLFCLETTALAFVLYTCHHYQSLNRSCRQGEIGDEAAEKALLLLCWAVTEWTGLSARLMFIYNGNSVLPPQWGAADAEIKVPSSENTELKRSPFKALSRSV